MDISYDPEGEWFEPRRMVVRQGSKKMLCIMWLGQRRLVPLFNIGPQLCTVAYA